MQRTVWGAGQSTMQLTAYDGVGRLSWSHAWTGADAASSQALHDWMAGVANALPPGGVESVWSRSPNGTLFQREERTPSSASHRAEVGARERANQKDQSTANVSFAVRSAGAPTKLDDSLRCVLLCRSQVVGDALSLGSCIVVGADAAGWLCQRELGQQRSTRELACVGHDAELDWG
ncbi:MAG: hypothetical protein RBU37_25280 [Myxococcota bacterium]|jgi:hypothetical protein|nr:hypothetical protein [Myxococcota bacterium]